MDYLHNILVHSLFKKKNTKIENLQKPIKIRKTNLTIYHNIQISISLFAIIMPTVQKVRRILFRPKCIYALAKDGRVSL